MANYSTTKLTPSSTTKFPANNGNTPGYVEGADLTTKAEFTEAITSLSGVTPSSGNYSIAVNTAYRNDYFGGDYAEVYFFKVGKLVFLTFAFNMVTAHSSTSNIVAEGLPIPSSHYYSFDPGSGLRAWMVTSQGTRFVIDKNGFLREWYGNAFKAGDCTGTCVYYTD